MATDLTPEEREALRGAWAKTMRSTTSESATFEAMAAFVRAALAAVPRLAPDATGERLTPKRRNLRPNVLEWTPAEQAIELARHAVERAGASEALTDAVILLGYARDKVAEHVLAAAPSPATEGDNGE